MGGDAVEKAETDDVVDDVIEIVMPGFPLRLFARWQERFHDLTREFALIALAGSDGNDVPQRLIDIANEVTDRYSGAVEAAASARDEALNRGDTSMDLVYRLPRSAGAFAARLEEILVEADAYCDSADLLTLAAPIEFVAFRHWYFGNAVRQCHGYAPVPWRGPLV